MYCPSCGSEERQLSQFCRACGTDLRAVRSTIERPDAITASAVTAREQIGMAVADKIRQMETARDLKKVAEDVLPQFEKFLESPEERRLRRVRAGVISAAIGLGWTLISTLAVLNKDGQVPIIAPGLVLFLIGVGIILNGLWFTVPGKQLPGDFSDALSQKLLDSGTARPYEAPQVSASSTNELARPARTPVSSITDHTTHHLNPNKQ
ncbi:MAG TPA: zinc ribbon domain-containing protein [Pyrinomonadaceae bacterium]|nr:zinc ribbon domain-containing protein [Pyrinomonadaceae bacterium]